VLDLYNETTGIVTFLVGDNCSVNQKIATLLGWMRSHRLNLEVNRFLADYETEFVALNNLLTS
ncbi:hypothetical protein F441_02212, partial [Phytophthora nicotianae CJ01A1]